ncbi:S-adenosyl-L-methionine-dependent methyltransferase [Cladochytrium replicatum]|nr:S-adenosyl-L-methionine-dependent methyltransferase [Cladochytrium replicatum]
MGNRNSVPEQRAGSSYDYNLPATSSRYENTMQSSWPSSPSAPSQIMSVSSRRSRRNIKSITSWRPKGRRSASATSAERAPSVRSQSTASLHDRVSQSGHERFTQSVISLSGNERLSQTGLDRFSQSGSSVHTSATPKPASIVEFMSNEGPDVILPPVNIKAAALWRPQNPNDDVRKYHPVKPATEALMSVVSSGSNGTLQHRLLKHLFGGKNFAGVPRTALENGLKVLDVGCGNAVWLLEMEADFPNGSYFGVDVNPSLWRSVRLGGNSRVKLQSANVLAGLPFPDETFDYVHQQWLYADIPETRWPHLISELARVLKPGGYLDIIESDALPLTLPTKRTKDMYTLVDSLFRDRGVNLRIAYDIKAYIEEHPRLTSVNCIRRTLPLGWDGDIGDIARLNASRWFQSLRSAVSKRSAAGAVVSDDEEGESMVVGRGGVPGHVWDWLVVSSLDDFGVAKAFVNTYRVWARKGIRGQFTSGSFGLQS